MHSYRPHSSPYPTGYGNSFCFPMYSHPYVPINGSGYHHSYPVTTALSFPMPNWNYPYSIQHQTGNNTDFIRIYSAKDDPNEKYPIPFPGSLSNISKTIQRWELHKTLPLQKSQWPPISLPFTTLELQIFRHYFDLAKMGPIELDQTLSKMKQRRPEAEEELNMEEVLDIIEKIANYLQISVLQNALFYLKNIKNSPEDRFAMQELIRDKFQKNPTQSILSILKQAYPRTINGVQEGRVRAERIQSLDLSGLDIRKLKADTFFGLSQLEWLQLNDNQLDYLPQYVFYDLHRLTTLYLNNNQLNSLHFSSSSIWPYPSNLEHLDLSHNQLNSLSEGLFGPIRIEWFPRERPIYLPLQYLDLSHNQLNSLPKGLFENLPQLERLYLNNNRITGTEQVFRETHPFSSRYVRLLFDPQHP